MQVWGLNEWMTFLLDNDQERAAQPMSDAEEFLYILTHDLKAFARALRMIPDWINDDLGDQRRDLPKDVLTNLDMLRDYARRMDATLDALTELSRVQRTADAPSCQDIASLCQACWVQVGAGADYDLDHQGAPLTVTGPENDLTRLFSALLDNAVRHHDKTAGTVRVITAQHHDRAQIAVEDDGPGIPPELRDQATKPLRTLRPKAECNSTGMGLAIADKVVRSLGGQLRILGASGPRGCRVEFDLPL